MRVALLGRSEALLETGKLLVSHGHEMVAVATGRAAPEHSVGTGHFASVAENWGCPFVGQADVTAVEHVLREVKPDIGVSANYPVILPANVTSIPHMGILNAHGGDLPRYRGNACQAWAIIMGETRIGLCIHKMVGGLVDEGDIVARRYLDIGDATTVGEVLAWINGSIPGLFLESLTALERDPGFILERQSADPRQSLRCYPRRPEDGRIDWSADARAIVRLINASGKPYSGAYSFLDNRRVTIWSAEVTEELSPYLAVPGQVLLIGESVVVAAGSGSVRITSATVGDESVALSAVLKSIRRRLA